MSAVPTTYFAIGHICVDALEGRADRLGGTVYFAAGQAASMGCEVTISTACTTATVERARAALPVDVSIGVAPTTIDTCFLFGADADSGPVGLGSHAPVLDMADLAGVWDLSTAADVVHLGPIFHEISLDVVVGARRFGRLIGVTPQGFLRAIDEDGRLQAAVRHWHEVAAVADAIVLNDVEFEQLASADLLAEVDGLVFRTHGANGASVVHRGVEIARAVPAVSTTVAPQRTIGAGDVFAAATFVGLARGAEPDEVVELAVDMATAYVQRPEDRPVYFGDRKPSMIEEATHDQLDPASTDH